VLTNRSPRNNALTGLMLAIVATSAGAAGLMWSETPPDAARAERTSDPVEDSARAELLSHLPDLRRTPAPFLRQDIPEPLKDCRLIGLREQPADSDPPLATMALPRPVLPSK